MGRGVLANETFSPDSLVIIGDILVFDNNISVFAGGGGQMRLGDGRIRHRDLAVHFGEPILEHEGLDEDHLARG